MIKLRMKYKLIYYVIADWGDWVDYWLIAECSVSLIFEKFTKMVELFTRWTIWRIKQKMKTVYES